jgi:hypothetical protein
MFPIDYAGRNSVPLQEPWSYAEFHIKNNYRGDHRVRHALAYLSQSKSFYETAKQANRDSAPLLWYYCFLNLAKAYLAKTESLDALAGATHGIFDPADNKDGYLSLKKQTIKTNGTLSGTRYSLFPNLCRLLGKSLAPGEQFVPIRSLLRQVLGIHRAYMKAFAAESYFIKLREPEFLECAPAVRGGHLWLRFFLLKEDFNDGVRFNALKDQLSPVFHPVTPGKHGEHLDAHCFESVHLEFTRFSADEFPKLQEAICPIIRTLILPQGYLYYVMFERDFALPQAAVIYAIMFYLGSIVRYRPYDFDKLIEKKYRWAVDEFLQIAPKQFVILMINELTQSQVSYFEG